MSRNSLVGKIIRGEMKARHWNVDDLSRESGQTSGYLSCVIDGIIPVSNYGARGLAKAFETSEELWINLQEAEE